MYSYLGIFGIGGPEMKGAAGNGRPGGGQEDLEGIGPGLTEGQAGVTRKLKLPDGTRIGAWGETRSPPPSLPGGMCTWADTFGGTVRSSWVADPDRCQLT